MAEPLKNQFGPDAPKAIASMIAQVHPDFPTPAFLRDALNGYDELELMPRGRHVARRHPSPPALGATATGLSRGGGADRRQGDVAW
jgi:hypothetical protein